MAVTIRDVAKAAGVSAAAVSKVLHGKQGGTIRVSEERAEHIRSVAASLNYVPNVVARNLRHKRAHNVGLVFENFGSISAGPLYYIYLLDGLASVLFARHYRLTILPEIDHASGIKQLANGELDGVIWCKLLPDQRTSHALELTGLPVVVLNSPLAIAPKQATTIRCDNAQGSAMVVEHLYELGHRSIAFVKESHEEFTPDALDRYNAFVQAMRGHGLPLPEGHCLVWDYRASQFPEWWRSSRSATALYAWNEGLAANILRQCREHGVRVPGDLSVVGFDSTAFCETTLPALTAVGQPIREMAHTAADSLLNMIEGGDANTKSFVFPVTLDVRGSTGPPDKHSKLSPAIMKQKAFTLIELLVVIAIIAILAAILFPVFAQAKEAAKKTQSLSNVKQLGSSVAIYIADVDDSYPMSEYGGGSSGLPYINYATSLFPYVKNGDNQVSPGDASPRSFGKDGLFRSPGNPRNPQSSAPGNHEGAFSYGVHRSIFTDNYEHPGTGPVNAPMNATAIDNVADKIMMIEKGTNAPGAGWNYPWFHDWQQMWVGPILTVPGDPNTRFRDGVDVYNPSSPMYDPRFDSDCGTSSSGAWECAAHPRYRFQRTAPAVFTDTHAKAMGKGQIKWFQNIWIDRRNQLNYSWVYGYLNGGGWGFPGIR